MRSRLAGAVAGTILSTVLAAAPAAYANDHVSLRVEGAKRTLIRTTLHALPDAPVIKDGNPEHSCAGGSALGALEAAPGDFTASWYPGLAYQVDSVRGESHTFAGNKTYWSFWVNDKLASTGLCGYTVKPHDHILLFPECATSGCKSSRPLEVRAHRRARAGHRFRVKVVAFTPDGRAHRVRHAVVRGGGHRARTNRRGIAKLRIRHAGRYRLRATKRGAYVRSDVRRIRIHR